jgi:xanthine/uracil permease
MQRFKTTRNVDLGTVGISLALTLAVILILSIFAGRAFPGTPGVILSIALGWATALSLGTTYACVKAVKEGHEARVLMPRGAKGKGRRP